MVVLLKVEVECGGLEDDVRWHAARHKGGGASVAPHLGK